MSVLASLETQQRGVSGNVFSHRRYDLDWLRVLVILVVFVFHCGRFFDTDGWHVKNPVRHETVTVWTVFLVCWMMPLIFVISGASTFYALGSRNAGKFVKGRFLRLVIPLLVGIFTHIAFQVYLERLSFSGFRGSFLEFYPQYFNGFYGSGGNFAWMGLHLWYLEMLFLFSICLLPLLLWLMGESGSAWFRRVCRPLNKTGTIYLLALPLMVLIASLDPKTFWGQRMFGGWPLIIYLFYLLYGFAIVARLETEQQVEKLRWISLGSGGFVFLALLVFWKTGGEPKYGTLRYAALLSMYALASWCFVLAALGLGRRFLGFTNAFVRYGNEAVLPFYVLHQTVILAVGYVVVRSALPDLVKFITIGCISFLLIIAMYEFTIRRSNLLRFLFGMKPRSLIRA